MKIGWILYDEYGNVEFLTMEPEYYSGRLVKIVYAEVIE